MADLTLDDIKKLKLGSDIYGAPMGLGNAGLSLENKYTLPKAQIEQMPQGNVYEGLPLTKANFMQQVKTIQGNPGYTMQGLEPVFKDPGAANTNKALQDLAAIRDNLQSPVYNPASAEADPYAKFALAMSSFFGGGQAAKGYMEGLQAQQGQINQKAMINYKAQLDANEKKLEAAKMNLQAAQGMDKQAWQAAKEDYDKKLQIYLKSNELNATAQNKHKEELINALSKKYATDFRRVGGGAAGKQKSDFYYATGTKDAFGTAQTAMLKNDKAEIDADVAKYEAVVTPKYQRPATWNDSNVIAEWFAANPEGQLTYDILKTLKVTDTNALQEDVNSYRRKKERAALGKYVQGYRKDLDVSTLEKDIQENPSLVWEKVLSKTSVTEENKAANNAQKQANANAKAEAKVEEKIDTKLAEAFDGYIKDLHSKNPQSKVGDIIAKNPAIRNSKDEAVKARYLIRYYKANELNNYIAKITKNEDVRKYFKVYFENMNSDKNAPYYQNISNDFKNMLNNAPINDNTKKALLDIYEMVKY
jgi:hypothetical protein